MSAMTTRVYRITSTGERIELGRDEVRSNDPDQAFISFGWPDCLCARCIAQQLDGMTA